MNHQPPQHNRIIRRLAGPLAIALALWLTLSTGAPAQDRQPGPANADIVLHPPFREPVALRSRNGVLEVSLTAAQSTATFNTVAQPVDGLLLYSWTLIQGESDGARSGEHQYPGPTLMVDPGDRLILHVANELKDLTIADLVNPTLTPRGETVPLTPRISRSMPLNMHTHGLHVSPNLNSDNVMIEFEPGQANTYIYDIPADHPEGLLWYHPHRHQYTEQQVYRGLAGMLVIGHPEGNIPKVTSNGIPIRLMALQFNFVANRAGGMHTLNYPSWTQMISTWDKPGPGALASGSYRPLAAPINFPEAAPGSTFKTNWRAGPLDTSNKRGAFQFMPQNLIRFTGRSAKSDSPSNPDLPDHLRDVQFTVNGQFQPELNMAPGQTEIWVIGNFGSQAYMNIGVRNTATGKLIPLRVLAIDGNAARSVLPGNDPEGTTVLLPSSSRVAIAVTMPKQGGLQLELPPVAGPQANHTQPLQSEGILYTSRGGGHPATAVTGVVAIDPHAVNWFDGFKSTPTQVLARATAAGSPTATVDFPLGEPLAARTSYRDLSAGTPDLTRSFTIGGGASPHVAPEEPNGFMYMFDQTTWPTTPVIHPRLNSIEEWQFTNTNNDQHPIHIHVNDFEISKRIDPVAGTTSGPQPFAVDNFNVPAPTLGPDDSVREPGRLWLRSSFRDFLGTFVMHCHRLDHEDNGLMMTVNVIPEISTVATVESPQERTSARVVVRDQADGRVLGAVTPFPGTASLPSIAMADVDGDAVLDLIAGQGPGGRPEVVVYGGSGPRPYSRELARFEAYETDFRGGVSVTAGLISGDPTRNNIIVASGPGRPNAITVFSSRLPSQRGQAPDTLATFSPAEGNGGSVITAGLVSPGRVSLLAAANGSDRIQVFQFPLFSTTRPMADGAGDSNPSRRIGEPNRVTAFDAFEDRDGPVSLATGWIAAREGGVASVIVGQRSGPGMVRVFAWASNLQGQSPMYVESSHHQQAVSFTPTLTFTPLQGPVSVATTSTTAGADLIVSGREGARSVARIYTALRSAAVPTQLAAQPGRTLIRSRGELAVAGG